MTWARYDEIAPHYDAAIRPLERWFLASLRQKTFSQLPENARLLEVGAGTGLNFVLYPPKTGGVATEPSIEMLKIAGEKERPQGVRLVQSCAESLPFDDDSFDAAVATLVFCSVASPHRAFAELKRVVKSGGMILLLEHVRPNGVLGRIFDLLNLITVPLCNDHFNRRTVTEVRGAGLELLRVEERLMGIMNIIACRV
ncbi:MAG: class I SAM-dependent methyltransferase [Pyrinomonadaceae bacterium]